MPAALANGKSSPPIQEEQEEVQQAPSAATEILETKTATRDPNEEPILQPFKYPDREFKVALEHLKSSDWEENFRAIDTIRRLSLFHQEILVVQL